MKVKIVGIQKLDYPSRKTGEQVVGTTLHVEFPDSQVDGLAVDSFFISDRLNCPDISRAMIGDMVDIEFNRRGYVQGVSLVE